MSHISRKSTLGSALVLALLSLSGQTSTAQPTYTTFDVPGSTNTYPMSINKTGSVAGDYDSNSGMHGFVRAPDGTITSFDPQRSIQTVANRINCRCNVGSHYDGSKRMASCGCQAG
jgi:hypothetical protein